MIDRITNRTSNPYGKGPQELDQIRANLEHVEPLLRRGATLEIDTRIPIDDVVQAILDDAEVAKSQESWRKRSTNH